jgi:hypothetical protein
MKKLLFLFCCFAVGLCAQPAALDLGSHGSLTLYFPGDWKFTGTDMNNQVTLTVSPSGEANAAATITVTYPEQDRFDTKARLKLRVEADNRNMAEGSVEGKAVAKEFSLAQGYGFYCSFTDPELRGKPPEKGNYKVMSVGKIHLAPDVLVEVSISADGFKDEPYQQLLGAIEGMEFKKGR